MGRSPEYFLQTAKILKIHYPKAQAEMQPPKRQQPGNKPDFVDSCYLKIIFPLRRAGNQTETHSVLLSDIQRCIGKVINYFTICNQCRQFLFPDPGFMARAVSLLLWSAFVQVFLWTTSHVRSHHVFSGSMTAESERRSS